VVPNGEMDVSVGTGSDEAEIVKETGAELTPELDTVIDAVPAEAISEAEMRAVSCVELTNVVARAELFQLTTDVFRKFEPFTVRVKPEGLHDGVEADEVVDAEMPEMTGGEIVKGTCGDVFPLDPTGAGLISATWAI
jgi:hypothetical protein